jgi:predicted DsbA family dithiol-disulfide isomerase
MSESIKVDIWSDVQCPWCYIGKRKFEDGAARFGGEVDVEYHSFELAPDTPLDYEGSTYDFASENKGIPVAEVKQMIARITGVAETVGLHFDYDHVHQTNTIRSHELLHFAKSKGLQLEMKERLLKAYFVEGEHLGRIDVLANLAAEVGLNRAEAVVALAGKAFLADVKADVAQAQAYGIQGVPFFVIDGKYGVSGAQDASAFAEVLERARTERAATSVAAVGETR